MIDSATGKEMTDQEILKESLDMLANVVAFLYETESFEGQSCAFMCDSLIKYMQVVYRGDNLLDAASDYNAYEEECYQQRELTKLNQ